MKKESSKISKLLNKLAAKRFSKNEKIALLIFSFFLIGFIYFYLINWIKANKEEIKVIAPLTPVRTDRQTPASRQTQSAKIEQKDEKKDSIRDPFLSSKNIESLVSNIKQIPKANLELKGILWDEQIPTAIINSKVVKIGDLIFGKTVVDIERNKVVLMEDGKVYILHLKKK